MTKLDLYNLLVEIIATVRKEGQEDEIEDLNKRYERLSEKILKKPLSMSDRFYDKCRQTAISADSCPRALRENYLKIAEEQLDHIPVPKNN